jgi:hypothetical protein
MGREVSEGKRKGERSGGRGTWLAYPIRTPTLRSALYHTVPTALATTYFSYGGQGVRGALKWSMALVVAGWKTEGERSSLVQNAFLPGDVLLCACLPSLPGVSLDGSMSAEHPTRTSLFVCLFSFGMLGRGRGGC